MKKRELIIIIVVVSPSVEASPSSRAAFPAALVVDVRSFDLDVALVDVGHQLLQALESALAAGPPALVHLAVVITRAGRRHAVLKPHSVTI